MVKGGKPVQGRPNGSPTPTLIMRSEEFLRAWSPENRRLRAPVSGAHTIGGRAALKIRLVGMKVSATVTGVIRSLWREREGMGVDLSPDAQGLRTACWLAAVARGEVIPSAKRAPRHRAELPMVIAAGDPETFTTTVNVSEGGCAVLWPGQLPTVGKAVRLRLGVNTRAPVASFIVRWAAPDRPRRVGLQLDSDPTSSNLWGQLVESLAT